MNCEDFLPSLETGGPLQRARARRHAARCAQCRKAAAALQQLKAGLARADPLTAAQRQRWLRAALEPIPQVRSVLAWPKLVAGVVACAAAVVLAVAVGRWRGRGPVLPMPVAPLEVVSARRVFEVDPAAEFSRLESAIAETKSEIDTLRKRVELKQASRRAEELLARFSRW